MNFAICSFSPNGSKNDNKFIGLDPKKFKKIKYKDIPQSIKNKLDKYKLEQDANKYNL